MVRFPYIKERSERKKKIKIKLNARLLSLSLSRLLLFFFCFIFILFYFKVGPTCPLFFHFLVIFSSETNYFVQVSVSFIIIEYSLNIYHFFEIFLKSRFQVSLYTRHLEIRKIFRLSQNLTKFDRVVRFRETNLTAQSVSSSEI